MVQQQDRQVTRRLEQAQEFLARFELDVLLIAPSADLVYLLGAGAHASERPMILVLGHKVPLLLLPEMEAPGMPVAADVRRVTYSETDDPFEVLSAALGQHRFGRIGVSNQMWAAVLLGLQRHLEGEFVPAAPVMRELRMRKTDDEIAAMRRAGAGVDAAFEQLVTHPFEGLTEQEIAADLTDLLAAQGLDRAAWGPIVGSGPNSASPHHAAGDRVVQQGDSVILDFGGALDGYQADTTRTVHVGQPDTEFERVYEIVRQAQDAAVRTVGPGTQAQAVDAAARNVIHAAGYADFFIHRTGHGIGLETHEEPYIVQGNTLPLEPGMTFSIEPGVYVPGRFGVRIEDIVAVTEDGAERLNVATHTLVVVA